MSNPLSKRRRVSIVDGDLTDDTMVSAGSENTASDVIRAFLSNALTHDPSMQLAAFIEDDEDIQNGVLVEEIELDRLKLTMTDLRLMPAPIIVQSFKELYEFVGGDQAASFNHSQFFELAKRVFTAHSPLILEKQKRAITNYVAHLNVAFCIPNKRAVIEANGEVENVYMLLRQVMVRIKYMYNIVSSCFSLCTFTNEESDVTVQSLEQAVCADMRRMAQVDLSSFDTARFVIEDILSRLQLKKFNGLIYKPVYVVVGGKSQYLQSYKEYKVKFNGSITSELRAVVAMLNSTERVSANWSSLIRGEEHKVCEYLMTSETSALPSLDPDDTLRAFRNGLYDLRSDCFYPWDDPRRPRSIAAACYPDLSFSPELANPTYSIAEFEHGNWFDIIKNEAPSFYKIIEFQFPKASSSRSNTDNYNHYTNPDLCMRYFCALIGRLFHRLASIDQSWECFLAIIGFGGTGKSKILDAILKAVPNHFIMRNQGEGAFGIEGIIGKALMAIEEISKDFTGAPSFMLQMGSAGGEDQQCELQVSRKYKLQASIKGDIPLVVVGNSCPTNIPNEQGQLSRRMKGPLFDRPVPDEMKDVDMPAQMRAQFPAFLRGNNLGYHNLIRGIHGSFDAHTPHDIRRDVSDMISSTSEARSFLESGLIVFDKMGIKSTKICPLEIIVNEFKTHKEQMGARGSDKQVTKQDIRSLMDMTQACFLVCDSKDEKSEDDQFYGCPRYELPWPFLKGIEYKLGGGKINYKLGRNFAYVVGIRLNYLDNPRVQFTQRNEDGCEDNNDVDSRARYFLEVSKTRKHFSHFFGLKRPKSIINNLDDDEKVMHQNLKDVIDNSITMREHTGVRNFFNSANAPKPFLEFKGSSLIDGEGLSSFDRKVLSEVPEKIDLIAWSSTRELNIIDPIDGKRWIRFELYSLYQRLRVRSGNYKALSPIVKYLSELCVAFGNL